MYYVRVLMHRGVFTWIWRKTVSSQIYLVITLFFFFFWNIFVTSSEVFYFLDHHSVWSVIYLAWGEHIEFVLLIWSFQNHREVLVKECLEKGTELVQTIANNLFNLPSTETKDGPLIKLPPPTTRLPREKPVSSSF